MEWPKFLMHNGVRKRVVRRRVYWSSNLHVVPHSLWILFDGETKFHRFKSDASGGFPDLDTPDA